jgi:prevent-host-death family protein
MDVGVRELKQRLSEYLDRAERGEVIRVTDRGVPKAVITQILATGRLEEGIAAGWIRPANQARLQPVRRVRPIRPIRDVLAEDRSE